jgi:hypothetical protein
MPGRGGISRGRGDADLTWGEEAAGRSEEFTPQALDPAKVLDPASTAVLGVGAGAPAVEPTAESAGLAATSGAAGEGVARRRLAPHHRDAVQRFFSGPRRD